MVLKYRLKNIDDLDDAIKALYEKNGDDFILKVDGVPGGEDVSGLKNTIKTLRDEKKQVEKDLKKFKDIDPDKYKESLEAQTAGVKKLRDAERALAKREKDIEKLEATLTADHEDEIATLTSGYETKLKTAIDDFETYKTTAETSKTELTSELHGYLLSAEAGAALASHKGDAFILADRVKSQLRVTVDEAGKSIIRVAGEKDGEYLKDKDGKFLTTDSVVEKMKADPKFANNFGDKVPGGSGHFREPNSNNNDDKEVTGAQRIAKGLKAKMADGSAKF